MVLPSDGQEHPVQGEERAREWWEKEAWKNHRIGGQQLLPAQWKYKEVMHILTNSVLAVPSYRDWFTADKESPAPLSSLK